MKVFVLLLSFICLVMLLSIACSGSVDFNNEITDKVDLENITRPSSVEPNQFPSPTPSTELITYPLCGGTGGIVFHSENGEDSTDIIWSDLDGSNNHNITDNIEENYFFAWSPTENKLFVTTSDGDVDRYIDLYDCENNTIKRLTKMQKFTSSPIWSPDGRYIIYIKEYTLFMYDVRDMKDTILTREGKKEYAIIDFDLSPDGRNIVFTQYDGSNDKDLRVMDINTSKINDLVNSDEWEFWPRWSPDGEKILYCKSNGSGVHLFTIRSNGKNINQLTDFEGDNCHSFSWSPDGNKIVFNSKRDGNYDLYLINSDGSGLDNLTQNDGFNADPIWSQDGKYILYSSRVDGDFDIFLMDGKGNIVHQITNNNVDDRFPEWVPDYVIDVSDSEDFQPFGGEDIETSDLGSYSGTSYDDSRDFSFFFSYGNDEVYAKYTGKGTSSSKLILFLPEVPYYEIYERLGTSDDLEVFLEISGEYVEEIHIPIPAYRGDIANWVLWQCDGYPLFIGEDAPTFWDSVTIIHEPLLGQLFKVNVDEKADGTTVTDLGITGKLESGWTQTGNRILTTQFRNLSITWDGPYSLVIRPHNPAMFCAQLFPSLEKSSMPSNIKAKHYETISKLIQERESGKESISSVESKLETIFREVGADSFTWLMRRVPVYDTSTSKWKSLDTYMGNWLGEYDISSDSRYGMDPVGTTVDIFFGNYEDTDTLLDWLGY